MNNRAEKLLQEYGRNPNVLKFLAFISASEGADYDTGFGGTKISLDKHPGEVKAFRDLTGKRRMTTAAGRYQFLGSTYKNLSNKLGLKDFSPVSQDVAAIELLRETGALQDIVKGDFTSAIKKTNRTWASLPDSPHNQRTVSWNFANSFLGIPQQRTAGVTKSTVTQPSASTMVAQLGNEGFVVDPSVEDISDVDVVVAQSTQGAPKTLYESFSNILRPLSASAGAVAPTSDLTSKLFRAEMEDQAADARNDSVARFISGGLATAPVTMDMPRALRRELDKIIADI